MFDPVGAVKTLSILIGQRSQHTICNEDLMKEEHGSLPASLSLFCNLAM